MAAQEESEIIATDHKKARRCSCYDSECKDVIDPAHCWTGNELIEIADGYCPLMFRGSKDD